MRHQQIKRIAIIGNAGSGKSTLARRIQRIFNAPIYHLDQYFWKPGWVEPDRSEYEKVHNALCDRDVWIIEGMNLKLLSYRVQHADVVIFLDIPRRWCIWNVFKRTYNYHGKETPSSAPGCAEKFNWKFIQFLKWIWDFGKRHQAIIEILQQKRHKEIHILRSHKDIENYIACLARDMR